jgi:hypothetical protein
LSDGALKFPWTSRDAAELWGTGVVLRRSEIAFLKHVVESYEGIGFTRMVSSEQGGEDAVVAVLATVDFMAPLDELLEALREQAGYRLEPCPLPSVCRERWFLEEWA